MEGEYQFYQRVSQQTVKREELDILRHSSQYDQTKRTYDLPSFSITNKKISLAGRFYSPPPSITSRSLGSSVRSSNSNSMNFTKSRLAQRKPTAKLIRPISDAESEYLPMGNSKGSLRGIAKGSLRGIAKDSVKDSVNERMGCDDYEMVGLKSKDGMKSKDGIKSQDQWKKKIAGRSSSSSLFKHLSRLRFK